MVDEGGRPQPELGAVLAGGVHDAEVVLAVAEQHVLLALRQLGDAAHQILDLVVSLPATHSWLYLSAATKRAERGGVVVSPGFGRHDFSSVLLRGITVTGEDLEAAVSGKHPQIHKDLSGKVARRLFVRPVPALGRKSLLV